MGHPFTKTGHISRRFYSVPISIPEEASRQLLLYGAEYRRLLLFNVEIAFIPLLLDSEKEACLAGVSQRCTLLLLSIRKIEP